MKKLQLLIASAAIAVSASAHGISEDSIRYSVKCIHNYEFLVMWSTNSLDGPSVVQMLKTVPTFSHPQPVPCDAELINQ